MVLMQAARSWGKLPSEVGLCQPEDDLTYMVALTKAEGKMRAWEQKVIEREIRSQQVG